MARLPMDATLGDPGYGNRYVAKSRATSVLEFSARNGALDARARKIALDAHARNGALEGIARQSRSKLMLKIVCSKPVLELVGSKVARTAAGDLQSAGMRVGLSDSTRAAMRHVTMKCTGDRELILGDGRSIARSP